MLALPVELIRHDMLLNPEPVGVDRIDSLLDDVVLPLILSSARGDI